MEVNIQLPGAKKKIVTMFISELCKHFTPGGGHALRPSFHSGSSPCHSCSWYQVIIKDAQYIGNRSENENFLANRFVSLARRKVGDILAIIYLPTKPAKLGKLGKIR